MRRIALGSLLFAIGLGASAAAQSRTGSLYGTATDPDGLPVRGVLVQVVNDATNAAPPPFETNEAGAYAFPNLEVGTYTLTATFSDFAPAVREGIVIEVGVEENLNVALQLAGASRTINVSGATPLLQTRDSATGIVLRGWQITGLPNNGGSLMGIVQTAGGVVTAAPGSELANRGGFNAAGMDENSNSSFIDGIDNVDPVIRNIASQPPLDAIQEVGILENSFAAEYGRNAGTIVNAVTKSGTNTWHGSLSNDLRNDNLDARNFFADTSLPTPALVRNLFAGTIGGPIIENRTFAFVAFEGLREKRGEARRASVPTLLMRQGNFSELPVQLMNPYTGLTMPYAGNIIPQDDWDPTGIGPAVLNAYPVPNTAGIDPLGLVGNRIEIANHITNVDTILGRVDHQLPWNTQLMGRFSFSDGDTTDPFRSDTAGGTVLLSGFGQTNDIIRTNVALSLTTFIGSSKIHEFRAGYNRFRQEQIPLTDLPPEQARIAGFVQNFLTFSPVGASAIGSGTWFSRVANVFNYLDQFTWVTGNHQFKTGVDVRRYQFNGGSSPTNWFGFVGFMTGTPSGSAPPPGIIPGYGVADLLLGLPVQSISYDGDPEGHSRKTEIGAYFQDDWQVADSLTLNLGIRWEWYGRIVEINDEQSTWDAGCDCMLLAGVDLPRQLVDDDWNNFAPRFGYAWQPFGSGTTVVRGGAGIYFDSEQRHNYFQIANPPFFNVLRYQALGLTLANPFPGGSFPLSPNAIEQDYQDTYFEHWSLGVQHTIARETVLEVAYIGNHGVNLQRSRDANGYILGYTAPPYPNWGPIRLFEQASSSVYHSVQTRLERRFFDRLAFLAVHTWGHSIDDRPAQGLGSIRSFQDHMNASADRADSDFDARHRFTLSANYSLPSTPYAGAVGQVLNGWAVSGIVTLQSGRPFTVYMPQSNIRPDVVSGVDPVPDDQGPDNWVDPAAFAPPAGPVGTVGRNTLRGPGLQVVDLAAIKNFALGEDNNFEFRAEFFNLFNHPNFGLPNPEYGPGFGTIGSTSTAERQIQIGLRYEF